MRKKPTAERSICELVEAAQHLACQAVQIYSPIVETILCSGCRDAKHIEKTLDGLLNFGFHPDILVIFKKLCRYYYAIDPAAAASCVYAYRDLWDSESESQPKTLKR